MYAATSTMTGKPSRYLKIFRGDHQIFLNDWYHLDFHSRGSGIYMTALESFVLKTAKTWSVQSQHSHCHNHVLLYTYKNLHVLTLATFTHANTYHLTLISLNHNSSIQWVKKVVNCQILTTDKKFYLQCNEHHGKGSVAYKSLFNNVLFYLCKTSAMHSV